MFSPFLVVDDIERSRRDGKEFYKAVVDGEKYFSLDCAAPIIRPRQQRCIGVAHVFEFHVSRKFTIVFFTYDESTEKACHQFYKLYLAGHDDGRPSPVMGAKPYSSVARADTSTIDPALAMSMGRERAVENVADEIAGREEFGIADMIRSMGSGYLDDL